MRKAGNAPMTTHQFGLNGVTRKKTVMANPVLMVKVVSFSIPQTVQEKTMGRRKRTS